MNNKTNADELSVLQKEFSVSLKKYISEIETYTFAPTKHFSFTVPNVLSFSGDELKNALQGIKKNAVYVISTEKISEPHYTELLKAFENCKTQAYQMPRIIDPVPNQTGDSTYLYVGSSKENVETRLKQHTGITESKSVYSLHLNKWFENAKIEISIYEFKDADRRYLQFIEDWLWDKYQPLFGKRGGK